MLQGYVLLCPLSPRGSRSAVPGEVLGTGASLPPEPSERSRSSYSCVLPAPRASPRLETRGRQSPGSPARAHSSVDIPLPAPPCCSRAGTQRLGRGISRQGRQRGCRSRRGPERPARADSSPGLPGLDLYRSSRAVRSHLRLPREGCERRAGSSVLARRQPRARCTASSAAPPAPNRCADRGPAESRAA